VPALTHVFGILRINEESCTIAITYLGAPVLQRISSILSKIVLVSVPLLLVACANEDDSEVASAQTQPVLAQYVGGEACTNCHANESGLWRGSHHDSVKRVGNDIPRFVAAGLVGAAIDAPLL